MKARRNKGNYVQVVAELLKARANPEQPVFPNSRRPSLYGAGLCQGGSAKKDRRLPPHAEKSNDVALATPLYPVRGGIQESVWS